MSRAVMTSESRLISISSALIGISAALLWAVGLSTLAYRMEARRG